MEAFLAFLDHVHGLLTTTYHNTPIMLMASPQWTRPDCDAITQFIFEKTKTPALCLIHSGIATQYGLKWPHMTVVDVGFEKVDVTCIYDSRVVNHKNVGWHSDTVKDISGGEAFTRKLLNLLGDKGFSYEMAEQLKRSPICEVLPYAPDNPNLMDLPTESPGVPGAAAASQGSLSNGNGPDVPKAAELPRPSGETGDDVDDDDATGGDDKDAVDDDGVLDVASIVASGQAREFLAKKEREKAERAKAGKKAKDKENADAAAAAKAGRLPNSKRTRNQFHYETIVQVDVPRPTVAAAAPAEAAAVAAAAAAPEPAVDPAAAPAAAKEDEPKDVEMSDTPAQKPVSDAPAAQEGDEPKAQATDEQPQPKDEGSSKSEDAPAPAPVPAPAPATAPESADVPPTTVATTSEPVITDRQNRRVRRDIEVGLERFLFADRQEIDRIVTTIYRTVQGIEDMYMRPACWENLVFVGNGARLRGLRDNIIQTLNARHLVSPSSATMFTSELPSNLGTPSGTGSQTPTSSFAGAPHQLPTTSSVNPLLQAATTASLGVPGGAGGQGTPGGAAASNAGDVATSHHFHSQTPTLIKLAQMPTYLSEWSKNGFEEAMFLGAQVAARLAFCIHNMDAQGLESQKQMSLNRVDYK